MVIVYHIVVRITGEVFVYSTVDLSHVFACSAFTCTHVHILTPLPSAFPS